MAKYTCIICSYEGEDDICCLSDRLRLAMLVTRKLFFSSGEYHKIASCEQLCVVSLAMYILITSYRVSCKDSALDLHFSIDCLIV